MIDGTPALTITLPIQRLGDPDFRALGNARHAQVRLVHLGPVVFTHSYRMASARGSVSICTPNAIATQ